MVYGKGGYCCTLTWASFLSSLSAVLAFSVPSQRLRYSSTRSSSPGSLWAAHLIRRHVSVLCRPVGPCHAHAAKGQACPTVINASRPRPPSPDSCSTAWSQRIYGVLPSWYVGTGTVRRDAPRGGEGPARYVLRVPEQLRNPDTLKVPEWENIRGITGT